MSLIFTTFKSSVDFCKDFINTYPKLSVFLCGLLVYVATDNKEWLAEQAKEIPSDWIEWPFSSSEEKFKKGTTLYVGVQSDGVCVRQSPHDKEPCTQKAFKGEKVIFLSETDVTRKSTVNGDWIEEKMFEVIYNCELAYVFGGALTPETQELQTPPMASQIPEDYSGTEELFGDLYIAKSTVNIRSSEGVKKDNLKKDLYFVEGERVIVNQVGKAPEVILDCENDEEKYWLYAQSLDNPGKEGWSYGGCFDLVEKTFNQEIQFDSKVLTSADLQFQVPF